MNSNSAATALTGVILVNRQSEPRPEVACRGMSQNFANSKLSHALGYNDIVQSAAAPPLTQADVSSSVFTVSL